MATDEVTGVHEAEKTNHDRIKSMRKDVTELKASVEEYVKQDKLDHVKMIGQNEELDEKLQTTNEHLQAIAVEQGEQKVALKFIGDWVAEERALKHQAALALIKTNASKDVAQTEDDGDKKKTKRSLIAKVLGFILAAGGAIFLGVR